MPCRPAEVAARVLGPAFGLALAVRPAGLAEVSGVNGAPQARPRAARMRSTVETSDAVKLSSCLGDFLCGGGECGGLVVVLAGDQAVVQAAEQAAEQVALGGGVPVTGVFAAVVVGAGAG